MKRQHAGPHTWKDERLALIPERPQGLRSYLERRKAGRPFDRLGAKSFLGSLSPHLPSPLRPLHHPHRSADPESVLAFFLNLLVS